MLRDIAASPGEARPGAGALQEGWKFLQGEGVEKNPGAAARLFLKAAEQGNPPAQFLLAQLYENGQGVKADLATALKWYRESAGHGFVEAQAALGNLYADGLFVAQDRVEAWFWLKAAETGGHKVSAGALRAVQTKMTPEQLKQARARFEEKFHRPPDAKTPGR